MYLSSSDIAEFAKAIAESHGWPAIVAKETPIQLGCVGSPPAAMSPRRSGVPKPPSTQQPVGGDESLGMTTTTWMGRLLTELSRDELIQVVETLGRDLNDARDLGVRTAQFASDCMKLSMRLAAADFPDL